MDWERTGKACLSHGIAFSKKRKAQDNLGQIWYTIWKAERGRVLCTQWI